MVSKCMATSQSLDLYVTFAFYSVFYLNTGSGIILKENLNHESETCKVYLPQRHMFSIGHL